MRRLAGRHLNWDSPNTAGRRPAERLRAPIPAVRAGWARRPGGAWSVSERERSCCGTSPPAVGVEIADELYVLPQHGKTHIKSIYRKLDTNRRWDAVKRARQLQLL